MKDENKNQDFTPVKAFEPSMLMRLACSAPCFMQIDGPGFNETWQDACEFIGLSRETSSRGIDCICAQAMMDARWRFIWAKAMMAEELLVEEMKSKSETEPDDTNQ